MDPRCFLQTLGQPALSGPTGDPMRFRVKKHLALLVYLGVEPRVAHRRDHLAELLWPSAPSSEARHSVATAVSVLRAKLGPGALESTRDTVRLASDCLAVDLARLEAGDVLGDEVTPPLHVDAFLAGFDVPDADEFDRWAERQQARLLPRIVEALERLIDRCRRTANSREMERLADRLVALDHLSEEAVRAKMESRVFAGDRLTALRIFEEWQEQLKAELGAAPSELVEGIAIRLRRRGWERTTTSHIASVPTDQWQHRPFVARGAEYRVLYEAWEASRDASPTHVLVQGDSGIGKSTIVERLSTAAGLEGASVSRVQCYELDRELPYAVVTGLVVGLLSRPGAAATPPEALAELSRTVPEVRQQFPAIPPWIDSQGEAARVRLAEAFQQLVLCVAEEHPAILVVDDMHLADNASLAVLHLFIRRTLTQPYMLVLTVRPGELDQAPMASRLLETATALGFRRIELGPLTEDESVEFVKSLIPIDEPRPVGAVRRAIITAAAGFPLVLELLVTDWQKNGEKSLALAMGAMTAELGADSRNLSPYELIFERVSRALDATARNVLNLAAVLGHRLNDLDMYKLADLHTGSIMTGLTRLRDLRVLREGTQGLEFVNELLRGCAYASIPSPVRRSLHSKVADCLLLLPPATQHGLELAWHCIRGGRAHEASPHLVKGAAHAIFSGAPHESERGIATGMQFLQNGDRELGRVLLAEALQEQGLWQESLAALDQLGDTQQPSTIDRISVLRIYASLHLSHYSARELRENHGTLLNLVATSTDPEVQVRAAFAGASLCTALNDSTSARRMYELAHPPFARLETLDHRFRAACAQAALAYEAGDLAASRAHLDSIWSLIDSSGMANATVVRLHSILGANEAARGHYEAARQHYVDALRMARRLGNETRQRNCLANLALCNGRLGRIPEQLRCADEALEHLNSRFLSYSDVHAAYWKGVGHAHLSQRDSAMDALGRIDERIMNEGPAWFPPVWQLMKADVLLLIGKELAAKA
ncbi:MAG TPA: AAA family ATPase, partial [Gemmatimonadales bacterium]|nr:AAA family ATPase [Gemmatimonadales bacterium]